MNLTHIWQRMATFFLLGCSLSTTQASPEAASMHSSKTVHVQSTTDLGLSLHVALKEQVRESQNGAATLEVVFAPGVYEGVAISLKDSSSQSRLEIVVRGAGPEPTVFKSTIQVHAARIRLENIVIADVAVASPITTLKVGESLHVDGVSWVGNTHREPHVGDPIVAIEGGYRSGPKQIVVKDSWFVGNDNGGQANLVSLTTVRPDIVSSLQFINSVFVDNHCAVIVAPEFSEQVVFEEAMVHETRADAFLWIRNTTTESIFNGGRFAFAGKGSPFRYQATEVVAPAGFKPVVFSGLEPKLTGASSIPLLFSSADRHARSGVAPTTTAFDSDLTGQQR